MTDVTRQQRRKLQREQAKVGRTIIIEGLAADPRPPHVVAVARALKAKLDERGNDTRASEVAGLVHGLMESSLKANSPAAAIACRSGCSYCCHSFVAVSPPEVFRISQTVRTLRAQVGEINRIGKTGEDLGRLAPIERVGRKLACPLLVENACSIYAHRPLVCRQATSFSVAVCIEEFEGLDKEGQIKVSSAHLAHASNANVALLGALYACNLPGEPLELSSALTIALAEPAGEKRWLAGDNIFQSLPRLTPHPAVVERVARKIADELKA